MPSFPASSLVIAQARITAVISRPSPRLTFRVAIDFEPLMHSKREVEPSLLFEEVVVPGVRDWRELAHKCITGGDEAMEGGFCVSSWSPIASSDIRIGARTGTRFATEIEATVAFLGFSEDDADPALRLQVRGEIPFRGLELQGGTLQPPPQSLEDARRIAGDLFDMTALQDPPEAKRKGPSYFFPAA